MKVGDYKRGSMKTTKGNNTIIFYGRCGGKTKALIEAVETMDIDFNLDIEDIEHSKEIREQLLATEGKNCKINWCVSLDLYLQHKELMKKENKKNARQIQV